MSRSYRFQLPFRTLYLVERGAPAPTGGRRWRWRLGVLSHITSIDGVALHDPALQRLLRDLGFPNLLPQTLDAGARMELEDRLDDELERRFELWEVPRRAGAGSRPLQQAPTPPASQEEEPLGPESEPDPQTWIEIAVVDDGGRPVANVGYRIVCPDGNVRTGTTDRSGRAREEGLVAGQCRVTFPEVDDAAWAKAS
jgi:hypothetical protein